jgi:hypothetical protein
VRKSAVASTCIQLHAVDIDVVTSIRRSVTVSDLRVASTEKGQTVLRRALLVSDLHGQ